MKLAWYERYVAGTPLEKVVIAREITELIYERLHMIDGARMREIRVAMR